MSDKGVVNKSITDFVPVDNQAFPLSKKSTFLPVVGHCPHCGAPIYGPQVLPEGKQPKVEYSCLCHNRQSTPPDKPI